jgi:hypothetical protein
MASGLVESKGVVHGRERVDFPETANENHSPRIDTGLSSFVVGDAVDVAVQFTEIRTS